MEYFVMILMTDDPRVNLANGQFAARGNIKDNDGNVKDSAVITSLSYRKGTCWSNSGIFQTISSTLVHVQH